MLPRQLSSGCISSPGATLTVALYVYAKEEGEFDVAFAIAAILMVLALIIHLAARACLASLPEEKGAVSTARVRYLFRRLLAMTADF